jgi:hypothetical protein
LTSLPSLPFRSKRCCSRAIIEDKRAPCRSESKTGTPPLTLIVSASAWPPSYEQQVGDALI